LSEREERWLRKAARQALRCTVARKLLDEPYREFSCRLAESGLLQQFCLLDTLEPIRVPSKSTLERFEKMLPEGLVRELVSDLLMQAGATSKAPEALGLREPIDLETFFLDTTCLKANIHFPVDWVLLRDATRTLMKAVTLIRRHGLRHRMAEPARFMTAMNRLCIEMTHARKREDGARRRKRVLRLMKELVGKVRRHAQNHRRLLIERRDETSLSEKEAAQILRRLEGVLEKLPGALRQAHERIIGERAVANAEKLLSLYEPRARVIIRGKAGASVEFGNTLLIAEQREGLIVDWRLYREQAPAEAAALVESLERVAKRHAGLRPSSVVTDRGFDAPESGLPRGAGHPRPDVSALAAAAQAARTREAVPAGAAATRTDRRQDRHTEERLPRRAAANEGLRVPSPIGGVGGPGAQPVGARPAATRR